MTSGSAREVAREMSALSSLVDDAAPLLAASAVELESRLKMIREKAETGCCPGSVTSTSCSPDRDGSCVWCGRKVTSALPKPALGRGYMSELDEAYGYIYDPDYGSDGSALFRT